MQKLQEEPLEKAIRDFMFEFAKSIKLFWLIDKLPFLKYRDWVWERIKNEYCRGKLKNDICNGCKDILKCKN